MSITPNRRLFLNHSGLGLGSAAMAAMAMDASRAPASAITPVGTHHPATAKRVIYLFQSGAPSQLELFDHKPGLQTIAKSELPDSVRKGQRLTGMTANQTSFPVAPSMFRFRQHGEAGTWLSELLPHTAKLADDLCLVRSVHTDAINHDPAITLIQTGSQLPGRPSVGAWVAYGLGTLNSNLPTFVVMTSRGSGRPAGQPLYDRLWGSGPLPSQHQGVKLRAGKEPILYLSNPAGCTSNLRREMLDDIRSLNQTRYEETLDPEIRSRIEQYELAFRMQSAVPELTDLSGEPKHVLDKYGPDVHKPGTFARNCLLARRLAERDVRFMQLFHIGWDQHNAIPDHLPKQCRDTDQPSWALVDDLRERGLLEDTVVIWGGEFGRTVYSQGKITKNDYGRDHHPRCFSVWMAGGGIKPGITYGRTDDYCYNVVENPVAINDLNATLLHVLGLDHERLSVPFQGLDMRLTGVEHHSPVFDILA
jgi:hypothetical protein